jgi:hypothetical protein
MKYRKLRIAFSLVCTMACVLLMALWVRSFWQWDFIQYGGITVTREIGSQNGVILLVERYERDKVRWRFGSSPQQHPGELRQQLSVSYFDERPADICVVCPFGW